MVLAGQTAVRCILINSRRKLSRQPRQKLLLRQPGLLLQRCQHVRSDGLLELRGRKFFIRSLAYPGLRCIPWPLCLNRSNSSPSPPLNSPPTPPPASPPPKSLRRPPKGPC